MLNHVVRLSATATMLMAIPAIAGAETIAYNMTAPVALSSFTIHEADASNQNGDGGERPHYVASGLTLDFVNRKDVAATGVTFLLTDGKHTQRIVDKGTFARGVSISHTYDIDDGLSDTDDAVVEVTDVDFADGGAWHAKPTTEGSVRATTTNAPAHRMPAAAKPALQRNDVETRRRLFLHQGTSL